MSEEIIIPEILKLDCCKNNKLYEVEEYFSDYEIKPGKELMLLGKILNEEKAVRLRYGINQAHTSIQIYDYKTKEKQILVSRVSEENLLINAADVILLVDKLLEVLGFKKIVDNYVILAAVGYDARVKTIWYRFEILFDELITLDYTNMQYKSAASFTEISNLLASADIRDFKSCIIMLFDDIYDSIFVKEDFNIFINEKYIKERIKFFYNRIEEGKKVSKFYDWGEDLVYKRYYSNREILEGLKDKDFKEYNFLARKWLDVGVFKRNLWGSFEDWTDCVGIWEQYTRIFLNENMKKTDFKIKIFGDLKYLFESLD